MPFPQTRDELIERGYRFQNHGTCSGEDCGAEIEWYLSPNQKAMPFDLMPDGSSPAKVHWVSCPNAGQFGKNRK